MNKEFKIIDLTHSLSGSMPTWDGGCGFELETNHSGIFTIQKIKCGAGVGTHMDAPAHVVPEGKTIDQLEINNLVTDCVVIDVGAEADENYMIMPSAIEKFEKEHGNIKPNSFVIFYTGWSKYWADREKYHNNHKFPSVDVTTAQTLLERNIAGLGIDTFSADTGANGFPVHQAILGAGKYLVENIANANELPPTGAKSLVLPMKIKDGTEAPIRLIAIV